MSKKLVCLQENIIEKFQGCLCRSCLLPVCFIRKYTEFHDMRMECQRKIIIIHFLLYYLFDQWELQISPSITVSLPGSGLVRLD